MGWLSLPEEGHQLTLLPYRKCHSFGHPLGWKRHWHAFQHGLRKAAQFAECRCEQPQKPDVRVYGGACMLTMFFPAPLIL